MDKTLIIWRRFGREHGEDRGFRVNTDETVARHLESRVQRIRETPESDWRWWQASDELLVELPVDNAACGPEAVIYYLPKRRWVILENAAFESLPEWPWYIHIGTTDFHAELDAWVFTDLFADVIVKADGRTHSLLDLDDLGTVSELGLVDPNTLTDALHDTQRLIDDIRREKFPPEEIADRSRIKRELGWGI